MARFSSGALPTTGLICAFLLSAAAHARLLPSVRGAVPVDGAASLTVNQMVDLALARNAGLLASRQRSAEAQGLLLQSQLRPNPSFEISAGGGGLTSSPGESEFTLGYSHVFEMGGKRARRMAVARLGVDLAALSAADGERQLRADVKVRFGEALAAARNLEYTDRLLALNKQSLRIAAARREQGEGAPLEQALIQVEVNRLESDRLLFQSQADQALLELKSLAGMRLDESLKLSGDLAVPAVGISLSEALDRALERRPDLGSARLDEDLGEAETMLARTDAVPDIVAFGRYSRVSSRLDAFGYVSPGGAPVPLRDTDNILAAGITVPLPARDRNQGNIEASLARGHAARLRAQYLEQVVRREVAAAYGRFESLSRALKLFDEGVVKQSESNLSVLRAAYELGELRLLDVINEQRRMVETEKAYTEILKESYLAAVELERVVGISLF